MSRVKHSIIPPGGWHYLQPVEGEEPLRLDAASYEELLSVVIRERINGGIDTSTVEKDVEDYICGLSPWQCSKPAGCLKPKTAKVKSRKITELINRILTWMDRVYQCRDREFVSQGEAERRAEICRGCPQNVYWHVDCGPCNTKVEHALFLLRGGRHTSSDIKLERKGCRAIGFCHRTAVHIDFEEMSLPIEAESAPDHCWAKKIKI